MLYWINGLSAPAVLGILVALTNILTEVTKKILPVRRAERVAVCWAELLSLAAAAAACAARGGGAADFLAAAAGGLLGGGVVAYVSMFGYDTLYAKAAALLSELVSYLRGERRDA